MSRRSWTLEEEKLCINMLESGMTYEEVANSTDRTKDSIKNKNRKFWKVEYDNPSKKKSMSEVEKLYQSKGFKLLSNQEYKGMGKPLLAYNPEGYVIYASLQNILNNHPPLVFSEHNPYTIWNIKNIWLPLNAPEYKLLSDEYTHALDKSLIWQLKDESYPPFVMQWSGVF